MSHGEDLPGRQAAKNRMQGMRIRDEFLCPITYELFREPVVASDGHTYEKLSIEKWLKSKTTSPRTGNPMEKYLTPNLNMQKLIQDMIEEGGASLYTNDLSDANRLFYVYAQKSLMMKCLGPPESKWNQQVFEVTQGGCIGGRRVPTNPTTKYKDRESVQFEDSTVSRIHFEIMYDSVGQHYTIRDLGSAGGTFIRIPFGKKKQLLVGSMILLGKHQFKVSSIEHAKKGTRYSPSRGREMGDFMDDKGNDYKSEDVESSSYNSSSLEAIVGDAEALLLALEELNMANGGNGQGNGYSEVNREQQAIQIQAHMKRLREAASLLSSPTRSSHRREKQEEYEPSEDKKSYSNITKCKTTKECDDMNMEAEAYDDVDMRLQLICFAPEGSPLIGISYYVGRDGASLGRAKNNEIPLTLEDRPIDNSVSQEHAHIEMDEASGAFFLCDGNSSKASTNGTWYRLSSPHQKSAPHELKPGMEILIGTVRFQATERMTIKEELIE